MQINKQHHDVVHLFCKPIWKQFIMFDKLFLNEFIKQMDDMLTFVCLHRITIYNSMCHWLNGWVNGQYAKKIFSVFVIYFVQKRSKSSTIDTICEFQNDIALLWM